MFSGGLFKKTFIIFIWWKLYCKRACHTQTNPQSMPPTTFLNGPWSGVNFINVFTRSFYANRSQKRKKLLDLTGLFVLLGSARVKAAHKMLVKLAPDCCGCCTSVTTTTTTTVTTTTTKHELRSRLKNIVFTGLLFFILN